MSTNSKKSQSEEQHIRYLGLQGLSIILKSLIKTGITTENSTKSKSVNTGVTNLAAASEDENHENESDLTASNVVEIFDKKQKLQEELENGILKFNLSPKKGLAYLIDKKHLENTPKCVAQFLSQYQDRLDKASVGEYLGREREYEGGFCLKVLHEYVDNMDFAGMAFDLAIRHFLNGFRLPGEAQKIDRIMEKFAERYYLQNRDKFASADMAFILAFSTIMLQTNLHNPAIRDDKRMTKDQFLKQNKGISSDGELPEDMLMDIYDRIAAEPIRITNDDKLIKKKEDQSYVFTVSTDKKRKDAYNTERIEMVRASEALFKIKTRRQSSFVRKANQTDEMYVRPMFEVAWGPIFAVLSQLLENSDEVNVDLCLVGFKDAIHLSCHLDFPLARDTFINALVKFTTLDTIREMQPKNVECIKILLEVAVSERDFIDESWIQILQSISQLARLQLFASGLHTDDMFFSENSSSQHGLSSSSKRGSPRLSNSAYSNSDPFTKFFSGPTKAEVSRIIEEANAELVMKEVDFGVIDQIFLNSQYLSEESIWHFVKCLCEVSRLEINIQSSMNSFRGKEFSQETATPRIFSLQKLVEVADYNMFIRPRIAWSNIWNLLAAYFTNIGMSDNLALSIYAMDSLKQLSIKFLQKEELTNFNFQRVFLKPFEIVMLKSRSVEVKDFILSCIDIMIRACASNIRSGWRGIFAILEVAANQDIIEISNLAFDIIERLMINQFELLIFDFVELMNCLVAFVAGINTTVSVRSLNHFSKCADYLAEGKVSPALDSQHISTDSMGISWEKSNNDSKVLTSGEGSVFRLWWPLLLGLATRVADSRPQVRSGALKTLHNVLGKHGHLFSSHTWSVIFKGVIFPMIDSAKIDVSKQSVSSFPTENPSTLNQRNGWIGTMAQPVFRICIDLFSRFQNKDDSIPLLTDLLSMLESCICQETESLAKMGLVALHDLFFPKDGQITGVTITEKTSNLVSSKLCDCILQNVCLDFAELGRLTLISETPVSIRNSLKNCPITSRILSTQVKLNDSKSDSKLDFLTPYGIASYIQVIFHLYL